MSKFAGLRAQACRLRHVAVVSIVTLALGGVARADLDAGALGPASAREPLVGVAVARDRPEVVAVWGRDFVWYTTGDGWVRVKTEQPIDAAALSRDGILHLASNDRVGTMASLDADLAWGPRRADPPGDGWAALVASRRGRVSASGAFAHESGDALVDEQGIRQIIVGDDCPCEGGGQSRFVDDQDDRGWAGTNCHQGWGPGAGGWAYFLQCEPDGPAQIGARGPHGQEVFSDAAPCAGEARMVVGSDGRSTMAVAGPKLYRLSKGHANVIDHHVPPGVHAIAVGSDGAVWGITDGELWHRAKGERWRRVALVEDDC